MYIWLDHLLSESTDALCFCHIALDLVLAGLIAGIHEVEKYLFGFGYIGFLGEEEIHKDEIHTTQSRPIEDRFLEDDLIWEGKYPSCLTIFAQLSECRLQDAYLDHTTKDVIPDLDHILWLVAIFSPHDKPCKVG